MLTISGVSAENIDDTSSVVAESPISADLDTSLSSCNAQNNDLSNYESSNSVDCDNSHESLQSPDRDDFLVIKGNYKLSNSHDSYVSAGCLKSYDLVDNQVAYKSPDLLVSCNLDDSYVCLESFDLSMINEIGHGFDVDEIISTEKVVDNEVILKNSNSFSSYEVAIDSTNNLDEINIFDSATQYLNRHDEYIGLDIGDSLISEVTGDMETSESYEFSSYVVPQANLLKCENDNAVLEVVAGDLSEICQISEPVFDRVLISSGYISDEEVYFGTISFADWKMLLEYVGADNIILFASLADDWNSNVTSEILKDAVNGNMGEISLDGYKVTDALLKYCPSTNEVHVSLIGDGVEDEHSHVINDTNSHGLDYAYIKHVNVIYKDMPNLMVLTSSGYVSNKASTAGSWDSLNDVLGSRMSSETLLPDHKAIWTPLLLLLQQDLQQSIVNSHADDNENKIMKNLTTSSTNNSTNGSNGSGNHSHHHKKHFPHHKHKHWRPGCNPRPGYIPANAVDADIIEHDNSTDDNESSNATATSGRGKSNGNPKAKSNGEPTYTLVYAIIGIVLVSLLFNSSYMKRDD
ncbi:hypothetical protein [Methanobrevibacter sp.]|uniref:hypothetical protein n=1 Tax=Methanobrevibacter sp. TaxID=66852 RepID=UPI0025EFB1B9|nr:hypothetical protein [Methanobrevibacter sp.]MBQ2831269.1 hypothetical protein [Methanobrevibacter sp.]